MARQAKTLEMLEQAKLLIQFRLNDPNPKSEPLDWDGATLINHAIRTIGLEHLVTANPGGLHIRSAAHADMVLKQAFEDVARHSPPPAGTSIEDAIVRNANIYMDVAQRMQGLGKLSQAIAKIVIKAINRELGES